MLRAGGSSETPDEYVNVGTIDVMGGFSAALAVAAALYQKVRTGQAGRARTSLSAVSGLLQIPFCYDYAGRGPFDEPAGIDCKGYGALNRFYTTASVRSLLLSASERDLPRLERIKGLEGVVDVPKEELTDFLAKAIAKASAEKWGFHNFMKSASVPPFARVSRPYDRKIRDLRVVIRGSNKAATPSPRYVTIPAGML
ncbi:crotonobetainyl-CoA:carnitine CoA-transferase CaiB-like acyl-CoA transferase [Bradyrhizobium sp. LM3.2]